jgi:hypothetical protein
MTIKDSGKYVHLGHSYDKDWCFIEDDKELQEWLKDGSLAEDDIIVEVKAIYKIKKNVTMSLELDQQSDLR